jgi:2-dehydropantoate 2-reductase
MKKIQNISVIGLGAIGCAYTSKLSEMDPECVKVIVNRERRERYAKNGFIINGKPYNFCYIQPEEKTKPADLLIVAVKFHDLQQTIKDIRNHVGPETIILSLLNGISSEEIIGREYGMEKMLYSMCVGIDAVRIGTSINFSNIGEIHFGEKINTSHSAKVEAVKELFERAKIPYVVPENMIRTLWWKFMVNVGINQTSAVLKAPYRVFQEVKEANELMQSTMREVISLSQKVGVNLNEDDIAEFNKVLNNLSPNNKTSMLQDIEAGRKTEVEMFAGTVCELGRKYQVATPINEMLFKMIRALEWMNLHTPPKANV